MLTEHSVALKCFDKHKLEAENNSDKLEHEINLLKSLSNEHVIKIYEVFHNEKWVFIVLEYMDDSDLLNRLKVSGKFTEENFIPILK